VANPRSLARFKFCVHLPLATDCINHEQNGQYGTKAETRLIALTCNLILRVLYEIFLMDLTGIIMQNLLRI